MTGATATANRSAAKSVLARAGTTVEWLLGLVLIGIVLLNVANATGRYLFSSAINGADEAMVFVMIFLVMAGAVLAMARRSHIGIDLLPSWLGGRRLTLLYALHDLVALCATGFAAWASWHFVSRLSRLGTKSMMLGIPMTIPHAMLLLGFGGMAAISLVLLVRGLWRLSTRSGDAP